MEIPRLPWDSFLAQFSWKQGEHLTLVGPTGRGKTTLAQELLRRRGYVIVFVTKKKDKILSQFKPSGYQQVTKADDIHPKVAKKYLLKPPFSGKESIPSQRKEFEQALHMGFKQGNWTIYMDEARYVCDNLGLARDCEVNWLQGRALGLTMVVGTQRPVRIPLEAYSQATHLFFFQEKDDRNLKTIGGLGGVDNKLIRENVSVLDFHEVLYLNSATGKMIITKVAI